MQVAKKRPEYATRHEAIIFHQDNARPHTSLVTRQKLLDLGWEVIPYPPYIPDLAPFNYHLFSWVQNHLNVKTFDSNEAVKNELIQFFASKNQTFYESRIMKLTERFMKLTERWQKVMEQSGQYIFDWCLLFILINLLWKSWKKTKWLCCQPNIFFCVHKVPFFHNKCPIFHKNGGNSFVYLIVLLFISN